MFIIRETEAGWLISGPHIIVGVKGTNKILDTGEHVNCKKCFATKGGASKACYKLNYQRIKG